ncbi:MAG: outer membrane protein assembly factor BamA [Campylobacterota bacterium]
MKRLLFLLLLVSGLHAQLVEDIEFEGLVHLSKVNAEDIVAIPRGSEVDVQKVNKAIKEFFEYGYFEDIQVFYEEGVLRFEFTEKPVLSRVDMSGYKERDKESILDHLGLKKGSVYEKQKLSNAKREILALLEFEGYFDSVVEFETVRDEGSIELDVNVRKGEKIYIKRLEFLGNENFSHKDIEKQLQNRQRDFMGWMWGLNDGIVKVNEVPNDKQRVKDFYMQNGYLDVAVTDGLLEVDFGGYKAKQIYMIDEGQQYTIGDIEVLQTQDIIDLDSVELKVQEGEVFNIQHFRDDITHLKELYADRGYAYARVTPDMIPNSEDATVDLVFEVEPNQEVFINDVVISGNSKTIDRVIRREVFLAPGDRYSLTDLKDSKNALNRTGFFESVEILEKRVGANEMDLEVKVVEQPTGSLVLGAGYGSYDGFIYNIEVSDKNIFGTGLDVAVDFENSDKRTSYNLRVTNPRVWDSRYSAGINIFDREYIAYDYEENSLGGSIFVGRRLSRHWNANLRYLYVDYDIYHNDDRGQQQYAKASLIPSVSFNNTDSYYFPREGMKFNTSIESAGLNGDAEFTKTEASFTKYLGLRDYIDYDLILRYKARAGHMNLQSDIDLRNEKLYLGGVRTLRGYGSNSLSPRNENDYRIGGRYMFTNSVEASIPLIDSANMRLAAFYDYGMIGEDSFDEIERSSTGVAIEWLAPIGPIQFVFSKPLDKEEGDKTSTFEFTLGSNF